MQILEVTEMKTLRRIINKTRMDKMRNERIRGNMWDPKHNIVGTKEKNRMEHAHIENGRRSTSKKSS